MHSYVGNQNWNVNELGQYIVQTRLIYSFGLKPYLGVNFVDK